MKIPGKEKIVFMLKENTIWYYKKNIPFRITNHNEIHLTEGAPKNDLVQVFVKYNYRHNEYYS